MDKRRAKERIDAALDDVERAVAAAGAEGTAVATGLASLRQEAKSVLGAWFSIAEESVKKVEARADGLVRSAGLLRDLRQSRDGARAELGRVHQAVRGCGPAVANGLGRRLSEWEARVASLGLHATRADEILNDKHDLEAVRADLARHADGAELMAKARALLDNLRSREGGRLPLCAARLVEALPDLEAEYLRGGAGKEWTERLEGVLAAPLADWEDPPVPPDALGRARVAFDRLLRWTDVLREATRVPLRELEDRLVEVERTWNATDPSTIDALVEDVEASLARVEKEAQDLRGELCRTLEGDIRLLREARLGVIAEAGLERITVVTAEHHEHWMRSFGDARRSVDEALNGAAATGDLRQYLLSTAKDASERVARLRAEVLDDAVAAQILAVERDVTYAKSPLSGIERWLEALRIAGGAAARMDAAEAKQAAARRDVDARLKASRTAVRALAALATLARATSKLGEQDVDACAPVAGETLSGATDRLDDLDRRVRADAASFDAVVRADATTWLADLARTEADARHMGAPSPSPELPRPPAEWSEWPHFFAAIEPIAQLVERRRRAALDARLGDTRGLVEDLARLGPGARLEDRDRLRIVREALEGLTERSSAAVVMTALADGRDFVEQLTGRDRSLREFHADLEHRLETLAGEGFREWHPEIVHRVSALVMGARRSTDASWGDREPQLKEAARVLSRVEAESRRRAADEVASNLARLREARRAGAAWVGELLDVVPPDAGTLPPVALRRRLEDAVRRLAR